MEAHNKLMRAAVRDSYGPPEAIRIAAQAIPNPRAGELLIRVHATTVNRSDCAMLRGTPRVIRLFTGLSKPQLRITGTDFAGEVAALGQGVTGFEPGERVWGFRDMGVESHAEYIAVSPRRVAIARIPAGISFDEAAASAEGAHYAINMLNKIAANPGQHALVNGATGAIGSALIQLLRHRGLYVAAVGPGMCADRVMALGANRFVDYLQTDFTRDETRYDYVFDAVGKSTFARCKPIMTPQGIYISTELGPHNQNVFLPLWTRIRGGRRVIFPIPFDTRASLRRMNELLAQGAFRPLTDRTYALPEIAEAFRYVESGQKIGNVILQPNRLDFF